MGMARGIVTRVLHSRVGEDRGLPGRVLLEAVEAERGIDGHGHRPRDEDPLERAQEVEPGGEHERDGVAARDAALRGALPPRGAASRHRRP